MTRSDSIQSPDLLVETVLATFRRHNLLPSQQCQQTVVVAVSGGADSVCLLHILDRARTDWHLNLHIAHVDHALRPSSAADARFTAALAATLRLPFHTCRLDTTDLEAHPGGLEDAARIARYRFLSAVALNVTPPGEVPLVAVAHHAEDQAETVLLHLIQGSGLDGLAGMRAVTPLPVAVDGENLSVRLVRPLLTVRRQEIHAFLQQHGLGWREDDTNQDRRFLRNRLRHTVIPLLATINPNIVATLVRTASIIADEADRLAELDAAHLQSLLLEPIGDARVVLDLERWSSLDTAAQRSVLRAALDHLTSDHRSIGFAHTETLIRQLDLSHAASGPHPLGSGIGWTTAGATGENPARLSIHSLGALPFSPDHPFLDAAWRQQVGEMPLPAPARLAAGGWTVQISLAHVADLPSDWRTNENPWRAFMDAGCVDRLKLTTPTPGARIAPLGMNGQTRLLGDLFTDHKIPTAVRPGWPLIADRRTGRVLWACGIQLAHEARVTTHTRQVICISWTPASVAHGGSRT